MNVGAATTTAYHHAPGHSHHIYRRFSRAWILLALFGFLVVVMLMSIDIKYELTATGDALIEVFSHQQKAADAADGSSNDDKKESHEKEMAIPPKPLRSTGGHKKGAGADASNKVQGKAFIKGTLDGMDYFHCPAKQGGAGKAAVRNLVLLHGKAYSHKIWKQSGILSKFCKLDSVQVTAIDFDVKSENEKLEKMLKAMLKAKLVTELPVDLLVTPSASGKSIVTWLLDDEQAKIRELPQYVKVWMPVASPAVRHASEKKLEAAYDVLRDSPFKVVAVHGDQDSDGRASSQILERLFDARVVELKGGHAAYRDSPDDFVMEVMLRIEEGAAPSSGKEGDSGAAAKSIKEKKKAADAGSKPINNKKKAADTATKPVNKKEKAADAQRRAMVGLMNDHWDVPMLPGGF